MTEDPSAAFGLECRVLSRLRGLKSWLLGTGGWIPTEARETACVLVRAGENALVLDAGTGLQRLVAEPGLLDGIGRLDIILTHFHLDHTCGLAYVPALKVKPTLWAPGAWLYGVPSSELLGALLMAPISPFEQDAFGDILELAPGRQTVGAFPLTTRAQPRHWAPTAGLRVGDARRTFPTAQLGRDRTELRLG